MIILSMSFLLFVFFGVSIFYLVPQRWQWKIILIWSVIFYASVSIKACFYLLLSIIVSFYAGKWMQSFWQYKRGIFVVAVSFNIFVLFMLKYLNYGMSFVGWVLHKCLGGGWSITVSEFFLPMGISFYTLQIVGYLADVYKQKIEAEKNLFKFALFVTFFPQILQGPIGRYADLKRELFAQRKWKKDNIMSGMELMIYGYFKKMVIADRAAIFVNNIYGMTDLCGGCEIFLASILYSIQLYMDFSGCVDIMRGISRLFGIRLAENFDHPYFATTIKEFWRRWHMTLSSWLRDYIYIPLGGNRHGKLRKYMNLIITFVISGIWHGVGMRFLIWGFLHAAYQIIGELLLPIRYWVKSKLRIHEDIFSGKMIQILITFNLVNIAWIIFRAQSIETALVMIKKIFLDVNLWVLFDGTLYNYGLDNRNFILLLLGIALVFIIELVQYKRPAYITAWFREQHIYFRYGIVVLGIFSIIIFGIYGVGYNGNDFIYGQF